MRRELTEKKEIDIVMDVVQEELDFICYVDVETEDTHTILAKKTQFGNAPMDGKYAEVIGASIAKYVHPADREYCEKRVALEEVKKELREHERIVIVYRVLIQNVCRKKEMNIYYHDAERKTMVFVRRDITDSSMEQEQQREVLYYKLEGERYAKMQQSEFLERMSHEIRVPMNSILGLSYLTKELAGGNTQILENLKKIDRSAHFLLSFINDILDLFNMTSGNIALNQKEHDFSGFVEELRQTAESQAEKKGILFLMERRGVFEKTYRFDAQKLREALMELLLNGIRFTPPAGYVQLIVELLMDNEKESTIRFEVRDTGIGMEPKFTSRAFEPFEKEDSGAVTLYGGTGLGLTIAKNIIELMNGKIDVYSEKGRGSSFIATLKLEKATETSGGTNRRQKGTDYDFSGKRVLLAEDNEINIEITKNILIHKNFEVEVAVNGQEAVDAFLSREAGYYDAILMDIRMPVMDGLKASELIRNSDRADAQTIPIVAMTANAFEEDVRKSFEMGLNAHLSKPVDIEQMYRVLEELLSRSV